MLWLVAGTLLVLLLAGHDATMAAGPHDVPAAVAPTTTPSAHAPAHHHAHLLAPVATDTAAPVPTGQPCLTNRSSLAPPGGDAPNLPAMAPAAVIGVAWLATQETAPATIPPLPAGVRRALLQVYRN